MNWLRRCALLLSTAVLLSCGGGNDSQLSATSSAIQYASDRLGVVAIAPTTSAASDPVNGWWWNPAEGGRGFAIERQGNQLFMAAFLYENDGRATWYVATLTQQGLLSGTAATYSGTLTRYAGGQSLLGTYRAPSSTTQVGAVSITFNSNSNASLAVQFFDGTAPLAIALQRYPISSPPFAASSTSFQSGWWWNESEGGRGFFIEVQGSTAFVGAFMYDDAGQPTWYVSTANVTNASTSGTLQRYSGGQPLAGAYRTPTASGTAGQLTFDFSSATTATMTLPNGSSVALKRYAFNGGGGSGTTTTTPTALTKVTLQSDPGDYIGYGGSYNYSQKDATIRIAEYAGKLSVTVFGNESWTGDFVLPMGTTSFVSGTSYTGLKRYPFHNPAIGGMNWSGEGRGCNTLSGSFSIQSASYVNGSLASIVLQFEQHCENMTPALRGTVEWYASDTTAPPGPVNPLPAGLWAPPSYAVPASGSYLYLQSDSGDFVGLGKTYIYPDEGFAVTGFGPRATVQVLQPENWQGDFLAMTSLSTLEPGYYGDLQRYPFNNATKGGLSWSGEGRGCNKLSGWFAVDDVAYANGSLTRLKLRFEQHCEGLSPALRGAVNWSR